MLMVPLAALAACGDSSDKSGAPSSSLDGGVGASSSSSSSGGSSSGGDGGGASVGTCEQDPLKTGLTAQQTGVSVDAFDCEILTYADKAHEPDPMILKSLIYVESRFDATSVGCPNKPCGTPSGWSDAETGCYGLMQVVPACTSDIFAPGLLPNGHPNLTKDKNDVAYTNSLFNPNINVQIGVAGIAGNRDEVVKLFPGCTEEQYTMMAIGNLASHGSTKGCTQYNTDYTSLVLDAYARYSAAAKYPTKKY